MFRTAPLLILAFVLLASVCAQAQSQAVYAVDPANSKVEIHVAKDGFFKAFGHDHLVAATKFSGEVRADSAKLEDSSVSFIVDAGALRVMDPGESEKDRKEVQATMLGEHVLDVAHHPKIEFVSKKVKVSSATDGKHDLQVTGMLKLHGAEKPFVLPAHVQISDAGKLTCDLEIELLQSDFGITPYKAAGGAVRVKDKLKLVFHIVAQKTSS